LVVFEQGYGRFMTSGRNNQFFGHVGQRA
jgi:hypothetical protein